MSRQPQVWPRRRLRKRFVPLYLMMVPGLLYLLVNNYLPMGGLIIAFKDINFQKGIFASDWIGLKNFTYLFSTSDALLITKNTLLYNAVFIALNNVLSIGCAILLSDMLAYRLAKFFKSALLLPYLISIIIISYLTNAFLNADLGFVNNTILPFFHGDKLQWYSTPQLWPGVLVFINAWKNIGYLSILYLSSILGIDGEYYEAASLEGASKWQQIRHITLPLLSPTITIMVLLMIGRIFYADFGLFYQVPMNSGALYPTTNVIDTYVYRALMKMGDIGMSSAAGLYQSVVGFALVLVSNLIVRRVNPENALF